MAEEKRKRTDLRLNNVTFFSQILMRCSSCHQLLSVFHYIIENVSIYSWSMCRLKITSCISVSARGQSVGRLTILITYQAEVTKR